MKTDTTYNGWTNRETWLVGVWDFFDVDDIKEALQHTLTNTRFSSGNFLIGYEVIANNQELGGIKRALTLYLADWLEHEHEDTLYELMEFDKLNGYLQDHINTSISAINWLEIAEHYEDEIKEALAAREVIA